MRVHLLYFRLRGARRLEAIHGEAITRVARGDLSRRLAALSRVLLRQHEIVAGPLAREFGLWAYAFVTRPLEIRADEGEQLRTIAAAAEELARGVLAEELGAGVALHARFEAGVLRVRAADGPEAWLRRLRARAAPSRASGRPATRADRRAMLAAIREPIALRLQPIVSLGSRRTAAYEALLRGGLEGPLRGPERLLAEAARCGLRAELELASLAAAIALVERLPPSCRIGVNLSPDLYGSRAVQALAGVPGLPERLILEITEHLPVYAPARLFADLRRLRRKGALLALDDAGCGYLNMELVRALKPDIVKLCITVTRRLEGPPEVAAAVRGAIAAVRAAGAAALAEGVETETQARLAREFGCTLAQGYLFGRPRAAAEALGGRSGRGVAPSCV